MREAVASKAFWIASVVSGILTILFAETAVALALRTSNGGYLPIVSVVVTSTLCTSLVVLSALSAMPGPESSGADSGPAPEVSSRMTRATGV